MSAPRDQQPRPSGIEVVSEVSDLAVGVGMLMFTLAPFALPSLALVALAAVVLLIPVLGVALLAAPLLVVWRDGRSRNRASVAWSPGRPDEGEAGSEPVRHKLVLRGEPAG